MKLLLLVNSSASSVTARSRVVIQKALSADHEVSVAETSRRGHATRLALGAASAGAEVVVVLGGDGTLNEAANGLAGSNTALAPLPGGSTNVFCRTVGFNRKLKKAVPQLRAALDLPPRQIGLGNVNGRLFLFHVGMGYDAAVVEKVERKPALKRKLGQAVFVWAALATWSRGFDRKNPHLAVQTGGEGGTGEVVVPDGYFAICLNSNPYTYLGVKPLQVAPNDAGLDRPLVLVTLRTIKLFKFLSLLGATLTNGKKLQRSPVVDYRTDLKEVTVVAAQGRPAFPYQADGDYLGSVDRLTFTWEPDRLLLIAP
jgi:diacylglycerol kinase family enzyme